MCREIGREIGRDYVRSMSGIRREMAGAVRFYVGNSSGNVGKCREVSGGCELGGLDYTVLVLSVQCYTLYYNIIEEVS